VADIQSTLSNDELLIFASEAEEHLHLIEEGLLELETGQGSRELANDIFRAAHTLKGAAATVGYNTLAKALHAMEEIFEKLRQDLHLDPDTLEVLLRSVDRVREGINWVVEGPEDETEPDFGPTLAELERARPEGTATSRTSDQAAEETARVLANEAREAAEEADEGAYLVTAPFSPNVPFPAVRAFQLALEAESLGQVIGTVPRVDELEITAQAPRTLQLYLVTDAAVQDILTGLAECSGFDEISIESLDRIENEDEEAERNGKPAGGKAMEADPTTSRLAAATRMVRIDVTVLDQLMNLIGELVIDRTRLNQLLRDLSEQSPDGQWEEIYRTTSHLERITGSIQEEVMRARMLPFKRLFSKFPRMMRDLKRASGKEFKFIVSGEDTEIDRTLLDTISDPLVHLLRNAVDHGIEPPIDREKRGKPREGIIRLSAVGRENRIVIDIVDDGGGISVDRIKKQAVKMGILSRRAADALTDDEIIELIFAPGMTTADKVSEISGRGVGLDVVRKNVESLNGSINVSCVPGEGARFTISLPLTLATMDVLLVKDHSEVYALPLSAVREIVQIQSDNVRFLQEKPVLFLREQFHPLVGLEEFFPRLRGNGMASRPYAILLGEEKRSFALRVERLLGQEEVVIKALREPIGSVNGLAGTTILADGGVALILDAHSMAKNLQRRREKVKVGGKDSGGRRRQVHAG